MRRFRSVLIALIAAALGLTIVPGASGAVYTVGRFDDPSGIGTCSTNPADCSLRQAISQANGGTDDTIMLPAGTFTLSLSGVDEANVSGDLDVLANMSIVGAGPSATAIQVAGRIDRVFDLRFGATNSASISGVTIAGGGGVVNGAGIQQLNGTLSIANSTITDNVVASGLSGGGGIYFERGTLNVNSTTISNNSVTSGEGGGIYTSAPTVLNIQNSTISGNTAQGGTNEGGAIYNQDQLTLVNSTVSGNTTSSDGGGIDNHSSATITNSTISGNSSGTGGGGINNGISATYQVENSIIAGNTGPAGRANCFRYGAGAIVSKGHNIEDSSTCPFNATGDLLGANPLLNPLASNGGPTQTMALQRSSPAIRAANAAACPGTDQRGVTRRDGCDIGAFQYEDITPPVASKLTLSPSSFAARSSGGSVISRKRVRRATKVRFSLSEVAGVTFTVEKRVRGRRQGSKCKAKRRRGKRCTIVKALPGSFVVQGKQGANGFKFSGRLNGKKLRPGNYQLVATPTDPAANTGKAVRSRFKIVR